MAQPARDADKADQEPEEFVRFKDLVGKLLTVPKAAVDAARRNGKPG